MRKRRIFLIGIPVAVVAVVGLVMVLTPAREPEYKGKKLSEWVMKLSPFYDDADKIHGIEAISQIGTNALPYLIKWVGYETPAWKKQASRSVNRIFRVNWNFLMRCRPTTVRWARDSPCENLLRKQHRQSESLAASRTTPNGTRAGLLPWEH